MFHTCKIYDCKAHALPTPLHPIISIGPFAKRGIDFMKCNPQSTRGHGYILIAVDYFKKWVEVMPTFNNTSEMAAYLYFNHVIACFGVLE